MGERVIFDEIWKFQMFNLWETFQVIIIFTLHIPLTFIAGILFNNDPIKGVKIQKMKCSHSELTSCRLI